MHLHGPWHPGSTSVHRAYLSVQRPLLLAGRSAFGDRLRCCQLRDHILHGHVDIGVAAISARKTYIRIVPVFPGFLDEVYPGRVNGDGAPCVGEPDKRKFVWLMACLLSQDASFLRWRTASPSRSCFSLDVDISRAIP